MNLRYPELSSGCLQCLATTGAVPVSGFRV